MQHIHHMRHAIRLAYRHLGQTSGNPSVGCVLVKNNIVIAAGTTSRSGRPHAEFNALHHAIQNPEGAVAYVTLEPCAHEGKTPACARLLSEVKIKKLYCAIQDPDPRTAGQGIEILKNNNIEVEVGLCAEEAYQLHQAFICRIEKKRPFITLKSAISLDGKITYPKGDGRKKITNERAHLYAHLLRARCDAIAIGVNSVLQDNPSLDCRLMGMKQSSPDVVLFDGSLRANLHHALFNPSIKRRIIIFHDIDVTESQKALFKQNDNVILYPLARDLAGAMQILAHLQINHLLVEGGAGLVTSFLQEDLYDHYAVFHGHKMIGDNALSAVGILQKDHPLIPQWDITDQDIYALYRKQDMA